VVIGEVFSLWSDYGALWSFSARCGHCTSTSTRVALRIALCFDFWAFYGFLRGFTRRSVTGLFWGIWRDGRTQSKTPYTFGV
jgi:hypothetical protein